MSLNEELFSLFHTVRNSMIHNVKSIDENLSPMHLKSLKIISTIDECTGQKLADFMRRDKAQINRLIKELVKQSLIYKVDNEKDKRSQLLLLTERGNELVAQFNAIEQEVFNAMVGEVTSEQVVMFMQIAQQFKQNLRESYLK